MAESNPHPLSRARRWPLGAPAALLLSACATVAPGHAGVLVTMSGLAPDTLGEGLHLLPPLSHVDDYDLRGQQQDEDLVAITADGAPVAARASLVTYHVVASELTALEREVGPDYYRIIVRPIIGSTVRRVLAGYAAAELDTPTIRAAQAEITRIATARLRPFHLVLDAVDLRTLAVLLSAPALRSVEEAGVLDQQVQSKPNTLEVARQRGDALRERARLIAGAHALVAPTLTPEVLDDDRRRAEAALLSAPSTTVVFENSGQPSPLEITP